ncbi:PRK06851 family protein [Clostridium sp. SYSU_GA19001]|uniref:PRK06851 family protein n=1 Tax=Clostridium caldaquaticum TaxID=2940653 RepID=UPI00207762CE|nr:PRK06851 family protein [Clostridium caldaquaticum]MCM8709899.1 PRK06851 family protein [Clostridium caldaquaticum]
MKGKTIDLFPGGNTSKGFYSFYRYILNQEEARRIICIKGGPGTGKSSLMKKVAAFFNDKGYDIEYHHCSSDNNSLDGVVIKGLNVAILDGTAPHVVDPLNPGAVDEILNMGDCWNEEGFKKYRKNIIEINKEVGKTFKRAYRFIGAARAVHDDWSNFNNEALNPGKLNKLKDELKAKIFTASKNTYGSERHLFLTAFTPNGIVTYVETIIKDCGTVYVLNGGPGTGKTEVLDFLSKEALKRGYNVQFFHDPLIPERIEHIFIPELNTAVVTSNEINNRKLEGKQIYMDNYLNSNVLGKNREEIKQVSEIFYELLNKGLKIIASAKILHDQMETYYIPNMNFDKVNKISENIINKLLGYEKDYLSEK